MGGGGGGIILNETFPCILTIVLQLCVQYLQIMYGKHASYIRKGAVCNIMNYYQLIHFQMIIPQN